MIDNHPITPTPPPELFKQWEDDILNERDNVDHVLDRAWRNGFQAGADQELNECCKWLPKLPPWSADDLRKHRRPKPPSLKAGAIEVLDELDGLFELPAGHYNTILRALEKLDDSL